MANLGKNISLVKYAKVPMVEHNNVHPKTDFEPITKIWEDMLEFFYEIARIIIVKSVSLLKNINLF